jgi:hypothetical protein
VVSLASKPKKGKGFLVVEEGGEAETESIPSLGVGLYRAGLAVSGRRVRDFPDRTSSFFRTGLAGSLLARFYLRIVDSPCKRFG